MIATFEYIEQVVATCRNAARANEETPARRGNLIILTPEDGSDVMITGDIHGNRRNFNLIRRVAAFTGSLSRWADVSRQCRVYVTHSPRGCG